MSSKKPNRDYENIYKAYREKREKVKMMGGEKAVTKQHDAGKLTARERSFNRHCQALSTEHRNDRTHHL